MTQIEQIQQEILQLPREKFLNLRRWLADLEWERWDSHISEDDAEGKLDFLFEEARAAKAQGKLREL